MDDCVVDLDHDEYDPLVENEDESSPENLNNQGVEEVEMNEETVIDLGVDEDDDELIIDSDFLPQRQSAHVSEFEGSTLEELVNNAEEEELKLLRQAAMKTIKPKPLLDR